MEGDFIVKIVTGNSKNTRDIILETLKATNQATVEELAEAADISPVTVRHHLNVLQAEGLLIASSIRRKIGRPHYIYALSDAGHELFPKRYALLSSRLLDELKTRFSGEIVTDLLKGVVQRIITDHRKDFEPLHFEDKLNYVVYLLEKEGFLAQWELVDGQYQLTEYSCPYISIGQEHTEVCTFDKGLIQIVLNTEIEQHSCMIRGDTCCQFTIPKPNLLQQPV